MGLGACAPGAPSGSQGGGEQGQGGATTLALAWWGNPTRNKNTEAEIQAFQQANPNITLAGQPGVFASYWDKLATQTAGGQAPDIIQMDMAYISEYGNRGALLDLEKNGADTSKFIEGTVESGKINGQLVGVNAGINSAVIVANPKIFEKAKMDMPDDKTWTWDQLSEVAAEVASKAGIPFGLVHLFGGDPMFGAYLRQNGKELFTEKDVGFEPADAQAWFDLMMKFQRPAALGRRSRSAKKAAPAVASR
jgi:multiple sugar transport system substrate-binding protein